MVSVATLVNLMHRFMKIWRNFSLHCVCFKKISERDPSFKSLVHLHMHWTRRRRTRRRKEVVDSPFQGLGLAGIAHLWFCV